MKQLAVALLKLPDGKLVFQQRTTDAPINAGLLGVLGGHVEQGESNLEAVRRELSEETSLDVNSLTFSYSESFTVDREGEEVEYHLYEIDVPNADFKVYEGEKAEAHDPVEAVKRSDLTSSVKYTLKKIVKA